MKIQKCFLIFNKHHIILLSYILCQTFVDNQNKTCKPLKYLFKKFTMHISERPFGGQRDNASGKMIALVWLTPLFDPH